MRAALLALAVAGCAEPIDIIAFDVTLTRVSDCRQTGATTQCTQLDELDDTNETGRWLIEARDTGEFLLTLHDGSSITGLWFPNDGTNMLVVPAADRPDVAVGCSGEGGTCYFARAGVSRTDETSGCPRDDEHAVIIHDIDGTLKGQVVDAFSTSEDCPAAAAAVAIVGVDGTFADEPARAREGVAP